ncbi:hypothetical protein K440DRAFT_366824 [Wilcoxina mikolae CBS 423.85]|nr:hypothetical protein K440DRAFT_366824 [Wilcoxina mikolae CBS 423.85]
MASPFNAESLLPAKNDSGPEAAREAAVSEISRSQGVSNRYTLPTKATTLRINIPEGEIPATFYAPSVAESKTSMVSSYTGQNLRVEVPPRPKGKDGKELDRFECPYCLVIQCIKSDHAWKKHVLGDLQPYACTYPDCDLLEHFFDGREEWYKHETQQHRLEWFCNFEGHPQFAEESDFLTHMELAHDTTFKSGQISLLLSMFQRPSRSLEGNCNFCLEPSTKLKSHVSRHLEQVALFALPRANEVADSDTAELNSHFSEQNANGSANQNQNPQDGSKGD